MHEDEQLVELQIDDSYLQNGEGGDVDAGAAGDAVMHEERILEAIDQLRRRKARPDADRICNYLLRKYSVDARDTIADLHRLIEAEKVIQVDYKGNTSYRNASKWTRYQLYKNRPEGFCKDKIKLNSGVVSSALAELVVGEPDYLDHGVPPTRLTDQLLDGILNPTSRRMVEDFLKKEVIAGNLTKLANGNYSLVDATSNYHFENGATAYRILGGGHSRKMENGGKVIGNRLSGGSFKDMTSSSFNDIEEVAVLDSRSNSPSHAKPNVDYEDYYEIIVGRPKDKQQNQQQMNGHKENGVNGHSEKPAAETNGQNGTANPSEVKSADPPARRSTKSERKQRLCVRSDDSDDFFKFEELIKAEKNKKYEERVSEEWEVDEEAGRSSTNPSPTPSNNTAAFRSARRKRAKKVFDPSDTHTVKKRRGRQPNAAKVEEQPESRVIPTKTTVKEVVKDSKGECNICSKDKNDSLLPCRDCTVKAHTSCIYKSDEALQKSSLNWQCDRCKTCIVCFETTEFGPLVTCYICNDNYHYSCHHPKVTGPKAKWHCRECRPPKKFKQAVQPNSNSSWINNSSDSQSNIIHTLPPVLSPQVSPNRDPMDEDCPKDAIDPNIPDASDWTSEQVYQYFARLFPKEAEIFRSQEIDGHSLLLLKRSDVLGGLDLLLGPALKIYRHVLKLQVRRDDPRLYWL